MARGALLAVFVLPAAASAALAGAVMAQAPAPGEGGSGGSDLVDILGPGRSHPASEPVEARVVVRDPSYSCGELYLSVLDSSGRSVAHAGYFDQCYAEGEAIPAGGFSAAVEEPGRYTITAEVRGGAAGPLEAYEKFRVVQ